VVDPRMHGDRVAIAHDADCPFAWAMTVAPAIPSFPLGPPLSRPLQNTEAPIAPLTCFYGGIRHRTEVREERAVGAGGALAISTAIVERVAARFDVAFRPIHLAA
jgi:hypothetical protein